MPTTRSPRAARTTCRLLAGTHNTKLGALIHSFSIPAVATCPGASGRCRRFCYADRGFFVMPAVARQHAACLAASRKPSFPRLMRLAIARVYARVVRIHVAGDFYDADYVGKWAEVVRACPDVVFFAYTRSWRVPALLGPLAALAALPNMHLWFSEDRETGASPAVAGVRVAFFVADGLDEQIVSEHADLVFRERSHVAAVPGKVKQIGGALVCPHERDAEAAKVVTCSACKLCFNPLRKYNRRC